MKKSSVQSLVASLLVLPVCLITACGQDKTLDQYNHEKAQQDLAKVQAVSGTYNGVLLSNADKSTIGPMSIELVGGTQITNATQGSTSVQQATLRGTITLSGAQTTSVEFVQGFYDSDSGTFQVDVPVTLQNGSPSTIDLAGSFDGKGGMNGTLKILGYTENGGYFALGKGAALPAVTQGAAISASRSIVDSGLGYHGTANVKGSTTAAVLTLSSGFTTRDQSFANLFNPIKFLTINYSTGDGSGLAFPNSQWDQRSGVLSGVRDGTTASDGAPWEATLTCTQTSTDVTKTGWNCHFKDSNGESVRDYTFVLAPGVLGGSS